MVRSGSLEQLKRIIERLNSLTEPWESKDAVHRTLVVIVPF